VHPEKLMRAGQVESYGSVSFGHWNDLFLYSRCNLAMNQDGGHTFEDMRGIHSRVLADVEPHICLTCKYNETPRLNEYVASPKKKFSAATV